jgi:hypothetical protein
MPNRNQTPSQPPKGHRNPMQTSPDDDDAQVADQSPAGMEEAGMQSDETLRPQQGRKRRNQEETEEQRRVTQVEDEEAEDDEDENDRTGPTS